MSNKSILEKIDRLSKKYSATGQDLDSYLEGLLYADYMGYWNYIHLDTLLSLQTPKTDFPDEKIFIIYHQITELYFKLALIEIEQINKNGRNVLETGQDLGWKSKLTIEVFTEKMERLNRYMEHLINSFDIMIKGMEKSQFLKFRMALLPSSGFQSVQHRMIEIRSTDLSKLTAYTEIEKKAAGAYENLYWKSGANDLTTNKKTYTLSQFEKKYDKRLKKLANKMQTLNIWSKFEQLTNKEQKNRKLIKLLKQYDQNMNVNWKLAHYKSATRYLYQKNQQIDATGGTNWKKYLPPRFQKIIFFPKLWTEEEKKNWGKSWVKSIMK